MPETPVDHMAMRRSASEPISQIGQRDHVAGEATGSAWKLPPDSAVPPRRRSRIVGHQRRWLRSPSVAAALRSTSSAAAITCGWQRKQ